MCKGCIVLIPERYYSLMFDVEIHDWERGGIGNQKKNFVGSDLYWHIMHIGCIVLIPERYHTLYVQ